MGKNYQSKQWRSTRLKCLFRSILEWFHKTYPSWQNVVRSCFNVKLSKLCLSSQAIMKSWPNWNFESRYFVQRQKYEFFRMVFILILWLYKKSGYSTLCIYKFLYKRGYGICNRTLNAKVNLYIGWQYGPGTVFTKVTLRWKLSFYFLSYTIYSE